MQRLHGRSGTKNSKTAISADGESLQSSKGLLYVVVNKNGGCVGGYQAITGNLDVTDHLPEGALPFLANQYGTQPASNANVVDNEGNAYHYLLQITSEYKCGKETF
jgi:hypothetical protein